MGVRWTLGFVIALAGCGARPAPVTGPYAASQHDAAPTTSGSAVEARWRDGPIERALATAQPHTLACASEAHRPFECTLRVAADGTVHVLEWTELDEDEKACATPLVEAVTLDGHAATDRVLAVRWSGLGVALLGDRPTTAAP